MSERWITCEHCHLASPESEWDETLAGEWFCPECDQCSYEDDSEEE